jgi:hypothetical protein
MQAQRACQAVKSNENEGTVPVHPVAANEYALHKAHISVEGVRSSCTCAQVDAGAEYRCEISTTNEPVEIEDK